MQRTDIVVHCSEDKHFSVVLGTDQQPVHLSRIHYILKHTTRCITTQQNGLQLIRHLCSMKIVPAWIFPRDALLGHTASTLATVTDALPDVINDSQLSVPTESKQAVGGRLPWYAPAQACKRWHDICHVRMWILEYSNSGKINLIRFTLTNRFFDSIQQSDKMDACTLITIITYDYFLIVCIIVFISEVLTHYSLAFNFV